MVHLIPIGKRLCLPLAALSLFITNTYAQSPTSVGQCVVSSTPTQVRAEGLTERLGSVVLQCAGYTPAAVISGNLTLFYPVAVTNQVDANNNALDAVVLLNTGNGFTPTSVPGKIAGNNITFQGLSVTVPAGGQFTLEVSNVRGAAYQLGLFAPQSINASISS